MESHGGGAQVHPPAGGTVAKDVIDGSTMEDSQGQGLVLRPGTTATGNTPGAEAGPNLRLKTSTETAGDGVCACVRHV